MSNQAKTFVLSEKILFNRFYLLMKHSFDLYRAQTVTNDKCMHDFMFANSSFTGS